MVKAVSFPKRLGQRRMLMANIIETMFRSIGLVLNIIGQVLKMKNQILKLWVWFENSTRRQQLAVILVIALIVAVAVWMAINGAAWVA